MGPGVARDVVQRFLQDPINVNSNAAIHGTGVPGFLIGYVNPRLPFHHGNIPVNGALQARLVQHDRMQCLRQAANLLQSRLRDLGDLADFRAQGRALRCVIPRPAQHGAYGSENLAEFIVQLPGDVKQRRLLARNQRLRQFAALLGQGGQLRK